MLGLDTVESVAHVIQVALTPVFLLSGVASLLGVLSTRLARVADRVDALAEQLEADGPIDRRKLRLRLAYLRRRSHVLDAAVMMGTLGGVATSCAALLLFVGTLRDRPGVSLFVAPNPSRDRDNRMRPSGFTRVVEHKPWLSWAGSQGQTRPSQRAAHAFRRATPSISSKARMRSRDASAPIAAIRLTCRSSHRAHRPVGQTHLCRTGYPCV